MKRFRDLLPEFDLLLVVYLAALAVCFCVYTIAQG